MADPTPIDSLHQPASFVLTFDGQELPIEYDVYSIKVKKEVNRLARARIQIMGGNPKMNSFEEAEADIFLPGKEVEIKLGYDQNNTSVFKGIVEKNGLHIREGFQAVKSKRLLEIDCVDKAILLTNTYSTDIYEDKKDSEIISTLITTAGLSKTVTETTVQHPFLPKYNINDWEFILQRAEINGLILINSDNSITIKKPGGEGASTLTIKHGDGLVNFNGKIDAGGQQQTLNSDSYDPFNKESVSASATEPVLSSQGNLTGKTIATEMSPLKSELLIPQPIKSSELKAITDSMILKERLSSIYGNLKVKGVKTASIDSLITLTGFGSRLDGTCYVTSIEHELLEGKYYTSFGFGSKNINTYQKKGIDITELIPSISGIHIGEVKQIDQDPENEYRIKVFIPSLKSTGDGLWARLTHFYTNSDGGSFFIPELNTQVVLSFINEDPRHPVILGGLYTNTNKPYTEITADNDLKAIVSKEKLTLEFNDKDKVIVIKTSDKNKITISEKDKGIKIEDVNGNELETSESGISIISEKEIKITSEDIVTITGSKGVTVQGKASKGLSLKGNKIDLDSDSNFSAKGTAMDLEASGKVNIKGGTVNIN